MVKDFLLAFSARLRSTLLFLPKFRNGLFCHVFSLAIHAVLSQKFGAKGVEILLPGKKKHNYVTYIFAVCPFNWWFQKSCASIKDIVSNAESGYYWIELWQEKKEVFCDMINFGMNPTVHKLI